MQTLFPEVLSAWILHRWHSALCRAEALMAQAPASCPSSSVFPAERVLKTPLSGVMLSLFGWNQEERALFWKA